MLFLFVFEFVALLGNTYLVTLQLFTKLYNCKNRFLGRNKWCSGSRLMEWSVHKVGEFVQVVQVALQTSCSSCFLCCVVLGLTWADRPQLSPTKKQYNSTHAMSKQTWQQIRRGSRRNIFFCLDQRVVVRAVALLSAFFDAVDIPFFFGK